LKIANVFFLTALLAWPHAAAHAATGPRITAVILSPRSPDNVLVPQLTIQSDAGITNLVLYSSNPNGTNWTVLTNLLVTQSPYSVLDPETPSAERRFYRVQAQAPASPPGPVLIPAGAFVMGDPLGNPSADDEVPLHTNYLSAFDMDVNLVTQALWEEVYQWALAHDYDFDDAGSGKDTNHPVVQVSWYDAVKWCNARSEKEGLPPAYWTDSSQTTVFRAGQLDLDRASVKWNAGYRLPTEAEWEKAARGGAAGHNYPWQDSNQFFPDRANVLDDPIFASGPYPYTSPAGYFPPNGYGLYDMAGNVWEWCWDWYDADWYTSVAASADDTRGPDSGEYRVLRGGSWNDDYPLARCAKRGLDSASAAFNFYGFRCAKGP
jgi:formylglycine-generating enzyme required for sulfatase activity